MKNKNLKSYVERNGWHFNEKLYEFASSMMLSEDECGNIVHEEIYSKKDVDDMLSYFGVDVVNKGLYDYVYVAQRCKVRHLLGSIEDSKHLSLMIKEVCDSIDNYDGDIMKSWIATMRNGGYEIPWSELI